MTDQSDSELIDQWRKALQAIEARADEVLNPESDLNDEMTKLTAVEVIGVIRTISVEALKDE